MNDEFKKSKINNETRYTLESMTAGATGSSSVATATGSLGKVQKRGNILAQEKKETPKPRNFVAKNAKMGGAGQHKDKKKAVKQGDVKHKNKSLDIAEGVGMPFRGVGGAFNRGDDERHDLDPSDWYIVKDGKMYKTSVYPRQEQEAIARGYSRTRDEAKAKASEQGVAEGTDDLRSAVLSVLQNIYNGARAGEEMIDAVADELGDYFQDVKRSKDKTLRQAYQFMRQEGAEAEGNPGMMAQVAKQAIDVLSQQGVAEDYNPEYDDEAGMAQSNLLTTARAVMGLLKTIKDRDNLPEWGQEKIAKAEMMLVSVWDYLQSQKEMGNDPQQDVAEDDSAVQAFLSKGGKVQQLPYKKPRKADKTDYGSKHIGGSGDKMKASRTGTAARTQGNKVAGIAEAPEDRTSYQVAKILFDKGIKYDAAKENELINMIGMVLVKELMMTPKQARYLISYDEDFVSDTLGELGNMESSVSEVAPPGWEKTVKAMKKHDEIDNPFALAWHMKNKGYKSHKKESADPYFESLASKLDDLKKKK